MNEANPESLLIYKELLEHIQAECHEMNKKYAFILRKTFYDDEDNLEISYRLGVPTFTISNYRCYALRRIRERLVKAGIIERKTNRINKSAIQMRYILDLSQFWDPHDFHRDVYFRYIDPSEFLHVYYNYRC